MSPVKLILIVAAILLVWGSFVFPSRGEGEQRKGLAGGVNAGFGVGGAGLEVKRGGLGGDTGKTEAAYLALGDSYTIGESVNPGDRYPVQVKRLLAETDNLACQDPQILAVTGWTTGNLLDALSMAKPAPTYRIVSLLIGVNNQYQGRSQSEYRNQFELLLQKSIALAADHPSHVVVLSIPDYSVTPFGRNVDTALVAAQIDSFNRINYSLAMKYKVNYIDVTAESRKAAADPSLIAADGLHFSGKEYGYWARLMEPVIKEILKD